MRDFQRSRVYAWESYLPEGQRVSYDNCQMIVDYIWKEMGLENPPKVKPLGGFKYAGKANRLNVYLPERGASTLTIIHELAHSMTMNIDGLGHQHGPRFVGLYMVLVEKFIGVPMLNMFFTAKKNGVEFDAYAKPALTDNEIEHML